MANTYYNQFLLTKTNSFPLDWKSRPIGDFTLFYHPNVEFSYLSTVNAEIALLGFIYDASSPEKGNLQLLESISQNSSFESFLLEFNKFSGQFVVFYRSSDKFVIFNDACAQMEVYYDTSYSAFGSQPKIIGEVISFQEHSDDDARSFFSSNAFLSKGVFVGSQTQYSNIKHLLPNHLIDVTGKAVRRFFPSKPIVASSVETASQQASTMLKGFIKAASIRNSLALAVTAGYDSRVLFLASFDVDCKYFVSKHGYMTDNHYDIVIPQKLTDLFDKPFDVINDSKEAQADAFLRKQSSVDFPRSLSEAEKYYPEHVYINGNISEIARSYFGNHGSLNHKDLAFLSGFPSYRFVEKVHQEWLSTNKDLFEKMGYHPLDMFYWEEKMGNWGAKAKTEWSALGRNMFSPFNSRDLLSLLLSTPKKSRDSHFNLLYNAIIQKLSPKPLRLPINPSPKQTVIKIMKTLRVYNLYRYLGIKARFLAG